MFLDRVELYRWGCIAHSVLMASFTECTLQSFTVGTIYSHSVVTYLSHYYSLLNPVIHIVP